MLLLQYRELVIVLWLIFMLSYFFSACPNSLIKQLSYSVWKLYHLQQIIQKFTLLAISFPVGALIRINFRVLILSRRHILV